MAIRKSATGKYKLDHLLFMASGVNTHTHTHTHYIRICMKVIFRNQAHTGRRPTCPWFINHVMDVITVGMGVIVLEEHLLGQR